MNSRRAWPLVLFFGFGSMACGGAVSLGSPGSTDAGGSSVPGEAAPGPGAGDAPSETTPGQGVTDAGLTSIPPYGMVVLFGGESSVGSSSSMNDTWTFDGSSWSAVALSNPAPAVRNSPSMVTLGGQIVLYGGGPSVSVPDSLTDTWTFQSSRWSTVNAKSHPPLRAHAGAASLGGKVVAFGGMDGNGTALNDTWVFDGTAWSQVNAPTPPSPRFSASMAVIGSHVVLFGGNGSGGWLNDTWIFDGSDWTPVNPPSSPPVRDSASMATLEYSGAELVLFGGNNGDSVFLGDTWVFNGSTWAQVSGGGPPARVYASMASFGGGVVLFGGYGGPGLQNDTWTFDGSSWSEVKASTQPPARAGAGMAFLVL